MDIVTSTTNYGAKSAKTANPIAAMLDAHVDAHQAGVCDSEVDALATIGEDIARCAELIAAKLAPLTDARMVTRWNGRIPTRQTEAFPAAEIAEAMAEAALGSLDAYAVVKASLALYFTSPRKLAAAA